MHNNSYYSNQNFLLTLNTVPVPTFSYVIAMVFAFLSALTIAIGTVVRHRIARTNDEIHSNFKEPLWWFGMGLATLAYLFQAAALAFGTLLIVQPILMLKLMLTFPLETLIAKKRGGPGRKHLSPDIIVWAVLLTASIVIFLLVGEPQMAANPPSTSAWLIALIVGISLLAGTTWFALTKMRGQKRALVLGLVTGGIYGYVALIAKHCMDILTSHGPLTLLAAPQLYLLISFAIAGLVVQQLSFAAGSLTSSLPAMTIGEPITALTLGLFVLGESITAQGIGLIVLLLSVALMAISTIMLTRK